MIESFTGLLSRLPPNAADTVGTWVAALLTCAVLSHVFGENPFSRFVQYLFIGIAAGYAASLTWNTILWPRFSLMLSSPALYWYYALFFVLGLLLLARGLRSLSSLGNLPLGILFGIGAALALGGSLTGTLIPQMRAAMVSVSPATYPLGSTGLASGVDALLLTGGTLAVLAAFFYTTRRRNMIWHRLAGSLGHVGRGLLMVTFGALFAGAMLSFFALLAGRMLFLLRDWLGLGIARGFP